ncbi:MAG: SHOCT domain-containing protein [Lactobacillus sp.]|nr:SHOCT domain-containing protein [Lactobacillus sp.]
MENTNAVSLGGNGYSSDNQIKTNKEITSDVLLEEVVTKAIQIPGVKVDRNKLLAEAFSSKVDLLETIINVGPIEAGISREEINNLASKLILKRTSQSSLASFAAGIPGGLAMAATVPADMLQFFGMSLRLAQELSYLYGAGDLWSNGQVDDEKVRNQLILYCGVMFGVSGAVSGVRVLSTQIAKTASKKIPQKALTKTFWYPMTKKICSFLGYTLTKKTLASGVEKAIPVLGGLISGSINFASMMPMAKRLNETFDKAAFDYSDEEFNQDIEIINNETGEVSEEEQKNFKEKFSEGFTEGLNKTKEGFGKAKDGASNLFSKFKSKMEEKSAANSEVAAKANTEEKVDPIEQIKKYKELLDLGIVTPEEFEIKKKELLGL